MSNYLTHMLKKYYFKKGYEDAYFDVLLESASNDDRSKELFDKYANDLSERCKDNKEIQEQVSTPYYYGLLLVLCGAGIAKYQDIKLLVKFIATSAKITDDEAISLAGMFITIAGLALLAIVNETIHNKNTYDDINNKYKNFKKDVDNHK